MNKEIEEAHDNMIGTLTIGEIHPATHIAVRYIRQFLIKDNNLFTVQELFASCTLSFDRLSEICHETLRRFVNKEPVSDRYLMGLAWALYSLENDK